MKVVRVGVMPEGFWHWNEHWLRRRLELREDACVFVRYDDDALPFAGRGRDVLERGLASVVHRAAQFAERAEEHVHEQQHHQDAQALHHVHVHADVGHAAEAGEDHRGTRGEQHHDAHPDYREEAPEYVAVPSHGLLPAAELRRLFDVTLKEVVLPGLSLHGIDVSAAA